jgi:hypothetical protein
MLSHNEAIKMHKSMLAVLITMLLVEVLFGQETIRLNQIGSYPHGAKYAVAVGTTSNVFYVTTKDQADTLYTGSLGTSQTWQHSGDYNKYIVNSGISTYTLLAAYEHFPEYYRQFEFNIPESGNGIPDILDEALWNIDWMLTMQAPNDGGVYHKLTTANFSGFVMPNQDTARRYVVQKGTAATLNFAAVMAQASRIFQSFNSEMPGFAETCLDAALDAWRWARKNPNLRYSQSALNAAISRPVLQRMIDGKTVGLALRHLGAVVASFYTMEDKRQDVCPRLHLNIDSDAE